MPGINDILSGDGDEQHVPAAEAEAPSLLPPPTGRLNVIDLVRTGVYMAPGAGAILHILSPSTSPAQALLFGAAAATALATLMPSNKALHMIGGNFGLGFGVAYWGCELARPTPSGAVRTVVALSGGFVAASGALQRAGVAARGRSRPRSFKVAAGE